MMYRKKYHQAFKECSVKPICLFILLGVLKLQALEISTTVTYVDGKLSNEIVSIVFDKEQGSFTIYDAQTHEVLLSNAQFGFPLGEAASRVKLMKVENVEDNIGKGKRIILEVVDWNLLRYGSFPASGSKPAMPLFSYLI